MVNSGGETNDGGGFGGRCVFPHKGEAGTARMELEPGGPLPVPSAAGGHCAAEASIAAARWCGRALLGTPSLTVGVARQWPAPHWRRTRTDRTSEVPRELPHSVQVTPPLRRLTRAARAQLTPSSPGPWSVISRIFATAIPARR
ncbi:uncharacterized protein CCOS01_10654 [Colletotrichum costaricense]|uniref:Uncharacterized protein n=2 Tax=Colletotrichum acutatum species complex TaxID=2707335 RepID=A0AAJ0DYD4_9PEZI|nr:uncharacterized protein CCOS01_10654 [Colletotrichum costaricense]KAK0368335.1 hypothetical protein CLIM01_14308 [Colletotrichum limetticola]KAK1520535.1 hypothetical protein CCOS01_10654 [Colletotrichum costaricense]